MKKLNWIKFYFGFLVVTMIVSNISSAFHDISIFFIALSFINAIIMIRAVSQRTKLKEKLINNTNELMMVIVVIMLMIFEIYNTYVGKFGAGNQLFHFKAPESFAQAWNLAFGIIISLMIFAVSFTLSWKIIAKINIQLINQTEEPEVELVEIVSTSLDENLISENELSVKNKFFLFLRTSKKATCPPLNF